MGRSKDGISRHAPIMPEGFAFAIRRHTKRQHHPRFPENPQLSHIPRWAFRSVEDSNPLRRILAIVENSILERPDVDFKLMPVRVQEICRRPLAHIVLPQDARLHQALAQFSVICLGDAESEMSVIRMWRRPRLTVVRKAKPE